MFRTHYVVISNRIITYISSQSFVLIYLLVLQLTKTNIDWTIPRHIFVFDQIYPSDFRRSPELTTDTQLFPLHYVRQPFAFIIINVFNSFPFITCAHLLRSSLSTCSILKTTLKSTDNHARKKKNKNQFKWPINP